MITMFQVNHREDPPPVLLLQHVLNEGQRIAVVLRLGVQAAVVDHEPPLTGNFLGDDEARRGPFGVARLEPASLDEVTEDLLHGLFPLAPQGKLPVTIHTGVLLQSYLGLAIRSTQAVGGTQVCR